ncbi:MAG: M23 family metallopeptidase [Flavobacteriales bacterium]|nr:M23 family metallopeptidase [Flavobacteriales bacterium]
MAKNNKLTKKLTHNYRLVISSEDNWEEKFSMRLNRLNVFIVFATTTIFLIVGTIILIAFTPLKEYIPGYDPIKLRRESQNMIFKTDSLERIISKNQTYIDNLAMILSGKVDSDSIRTINTKDDLSSDNDEVDFTITKVDSIFRTEVEREDRYNVIGENNKRSFILIAPINGNITQGYNAESKHFAIDIATVEGTPVKAVADGTVIFSEWTSTTGNVIIIEHDNQLISVYKHNALSTKEQGDFVESGEVIASSGSTGELSSGPHLHFELWYNGYPVNPTDFINFEL